MPQKEQSLWSFKTIDWRITHFGVRLILSPTVNVIHYTVATAQPAPQHSL